MTRQITYLRGDEPLLFPSGLSLTLKGTGSEVFSWATKAKRALDIELRVLPTGIQRPEVEFYLPVWRYSIEVAHGDNVYVHPGSVPSILAPAPALPHRGLLCRLSARELRLNVWLEATLGGPLPDQSVIQVSAQPALGSTARPSIVYSDLVATSVAGSQRFPIEATEWCVRRISGEPSAIVDGTMITYQCFTGSAIAAPINAALLADWTPIPVLAAFWQTSVPCEVHFR